MFDGPTEQAIALNKVSDFGNVSDQLGVVAEQQQDKGGSAIEKDGQGLSEGVQFEFLQVGFSKVKGREDQE